MELARAGIRDHLGPEYPKLTVVVEGQNHAVLVRFGDPVTAGEKDFTADVIVAIDNPTGPGLYIPALQSPVFWEASNPEAHTRMILDQIARTKVSSSHVVRLLKHWCRTHGGPLCSWHIKVLGLQCLTAPITQADGLLRWFRHAQTVLSSQPTPDPAGVGPGIHLAKPLGDVLNALSDAEHLLTEASAEADAGHMAAARKLLAELLPGGVLAPESALAARESLASRLTAGAATPLATAVATDRPTPKPVRSWSIGS